MFLLVVQDVAGDLGAAETPHLQQTLGVVRQETDAVEDLRRLRDDAIPAQAQTFEDVADLRARPRRDTPLLNRRLSRSQDLLMIEITEANAHCRLVLPPSPGVRPIEQECFVAFLRHDRSCRTDPLVRSSANGERARVSDRGHIDNDELPVAPG